MKAIRLILVITTLSLATGCGEVQTVTNDVNTKPNPQPSTSAETPTLQGRIALVLVSDFFATGILSAVGNLTNVATADIVTNILAPLPHTDSIVRVFDGISYVVNRLGRDSIQVIDPADDFATLIEFSTGPGSNPHDISVINANKAYVTIYQPESVAGAEEIHIYNPQSGSILGKLDLTPLADDDGDVNVRPERMAQVGDEVWVLLQDLNSFFAADTAGKIAVIDTKTDSLVDVDPVTPGVQGITLDGRNPSDIRYDETSDRVFVSNAGVFQPDFTTDTSDAFGGIEVVNTLTYQTQGIVVDDADIGGFPWGIQIANNNQAFTIADSQRIAAFDPATFAVVDNNIYESPGTFLPEIHYDGDGHLLVSERGDLEGLGAGLVILDTDNDYAKQGPLDVGGPPTSLAIIDL